MLLDDIELITEVSDKLNPPEISKKGQLRLIAYKLLLARRGNSKINVSASIKTLAEFDKEIINARRSITSTIVILD